MFKYLWRTCGQIMRGGHWMSWTDYMSLWLDMSSYGKLHLTVLLLNDSQHVSSYHGSLLWQVSYKMFNSWYYLPMLAIVCFIDVAICDHTCNPGIWIMAVNVFATKFPELLLDFFIQQKCVSKPYPWPQINSICLPCWPVRWTQHSFT